MRLKACDPERKREPRPVRISFWQFLSKALMVAAIVAFTVFHFMPNPEQSNDAGWHVWKELWDLVLHPSGTDDPMQWVAVASFLSASLLIVVSPFLGRVWIKSKMAWLPTVIFSGITAVGFSLAILIGRSSNELSIPLGMCLLMAAPVLNFIGLLLARTGAPRPDRSQMD